MITPSESVDYTLPPGSIIGRHTHTADENRIDWVSESASDDCRGPARGTHSKPFNVIHHETLAQQAPSFRYSIAHCVISAVSDLSDTYWYILHARSWDEPYKAVPRSKLARIL
jgi:hypothetical protein